MGQTVVAHKFCGECRVDGLVDRHVRSHVVGGLSGRSGLLLLLVHAGLKAVLIHREGFLLQDLFGQVDGEAVGVVELEGVLAGEHRLSLLLHLSFHGSQNSQPLVDGAVEFFLFLRQNL